MRTLFVYLSKPNKKFTDTSNYAFDLDAFDSSIRLYRTIDKDVRESLKNLDLHTTCLAALDFDYLSIFDKIIVYGKYKYATFEFDKCRHNIIDYHVYDYNDNEIKKYDKELRYAHNLYKLVIRGFFDLNKEDNLCTE